MITRKNRFNSFMRLGASVYINIKYNKNEGRWENVARCVYLLRVAVKISGCGWWCVTH